MSCIAGVGGGVKSLVNRARRAAAAHRRIIALDGCQLQCAKHCLDNQGVAPDMHLLLNELGVKKRYHADATPDEVERIYENVSERLRDR